MHRRKTERVTKAMAALTLTAATIVAMTGQVNGAGITMPGLASDAGSSLLLLSGVMAVLAIGVGAAMGIVGGIILRRKPRE